MNILKRLFRGITKAQSEPGDITQESSTTATGSVQQTAAEAPGKSQALQDSSTKNAIPPASHSLQKASTRSTLIDPEEDLRSDLPEADMRVLDIPVEEVHNHTGAIEQIWDDKLDAIILRGYLKSETHKKFCTWTLGTSFSLLGRRIFHKISQVEGNNTRIAL